MIVTDVFGLHYESFLIQIKGTEQDKQDLKELLEKKFENKTFLIVRGTK